jgi:cellulose synthase/poly-beta-1,6-N-acetylglucosamine synthase-like glycosyltransferase
LGIRFAKNEILGIFDADTIMFPGFIDDCMEKIKSDNFICGYPIGKAHGCCVVSAKKMYEVGGYNEFLSGWGFDDQDLYNRLTGGRFHDRNEKLKYADLKMEGFNEELIDLIRHEDFFRTKYQKQKTIQSSNHINSHISLHSSLFRGLESNLIKGDEL